MTLPSSTAPRSCRCAPATRSRLGVRLTFPRPSANVPSPRCDSRFSFRAGTDWRPSRRASASSCSREQAPVRTRSSRPSTNPTLIEGPGCRGNANTGDRWSPCDMLGQRPRRRPWPKSGGTASSNVSTAAACRGGRRACPLTGMRLFARDASCENCSRMSFRTVREQFGSPCVERCDLGLDPLQLTGHEREFCLRALVL